jgi:nucleotide-binding universal stress UspA family protein
VDKQQGSSSFAPGESTMCPIQTILHPTDFSPAANFAFQIACTLAKGYNARLILLHVVPASFLTNEGMPGLYLNPPAVTQEPLQGRFSWPQPADPNLCVEYRVAENDNASEGILRLAQEADCDLIVMGTRGRSGLKRLLMGGVAEEVLRKSLCPVLTVKAPPISVAPPAEPCEVVDVRPVRADLQGLGLPARG